MAAGDERAFDALYARYAGALMAFTFHLTWDRTAAEDATQETFVKVWRAADRFRPGAPFEPWLYRIARNEALDARARLRGRSGAISTPEEGVEDPRSSGASLARSPASGADRSEISEALTTAVDELSETLRLAFVLVRLDGRSQEEAARILDVPVGTVKSRVAAAEVHLRAALARFA